MAQLATINIRLRDFDISEDSLLTLGRSTDEFANSAAIDIFGPGILIDVDLREGTLWAKVKASSAALFASYMLVANYPQLKLGLTDLYNGSEKFGAIVSSVFLDKAKVSQHQIQKIEYRTETPQRILRLLDTLETLDTQVKEGHVSHKELTRQLLKARQELDRIFRDITPEDAGEISRYLHFESLPPPERWPRVTKPSPKLGGARERAMTSAPRTDVPSKPRFRYHNKFVATPNAPPRGTISIQK